jgi:aqualysin 1
MVLSGTSMACPHVAGVAALYLDRDPGMSPVSVRDALLADAVNGALSLYGRHGLSDSPNRLVNTQALGRTR